MEETLNTFHRVLSLAGVSIFAKENWNSRSRSLFQIFNFIIGILSFIFTSGYVITNFSNLLLFIEGACIWTTGVVMTLSLAVCLFYRNNFRNFLVEVVFKDSMEEMPLIELVLNMDSGQKLMELKNLVKESKTKLLNYTRLILKVYAVVSFMSFSSYLWTTIYLIIQSNDSSLRMFAFNIWFPWSLDNYKVYVASFIFHAYCYFLSWKLYDSSFNIWFPWSLENYKVYVASFIFHAYCAWLTCIIHPGFQITIVLLIGQLIRQLRILGFILLNINELALEITKDDPERWQQCCTALLTQCVIHFISLKKLNYKLNVICRPFYLTLILVAILLVCMCSVKIAISNKLALETFKYYIHGLCYIFMMLMFCLLCQQVENECEQLNVDVTEKWYIFDKSHKKHILIFNMALSQGMPIYIFGSKTLSSPTFTWFINTGMSFFTLVMSVLEEAQ